MEARSIPAAIPAPGVSRAVSKRFPCKTAGCGGSFTVEAPERLRDWTEDDIDRFRDAMYKHMAAHPDSLKVPYTPEPRKRDWVGCRCAGTCRCPRRRVRR